MGSEWIKMPPVPFILNCTTLQTLLPQWYGTICYTELTTVNLMSHYLFCAYGRELQQRSLVLSAQKCAQGIQGALQKTPWEKTQQTFNRSRDTSRCNILKQLAVVSGHTLTALSDVASRLTQASPWPWGAVWVWIWRMWLSSIEAGKKVDCSVLIPSLPHSFLFTSCVYHGV